MNKASIIAFTGLYIALCAIVITYSFHTPREWLIHVLLMKDTGENNVAAVALSGSQSDTTATSAADNSISNDTSTTMPPRYEYKIMISVDPCTLNKLGAEGWQAVQYGGTLVQVSGHDETCARSAVYNALDWAVFQRLK